MHPEAEARYTCERCGNFICSPCTRFGEGGETFCTSCEAKAPSSIPWERRKELGIPRAFFETLKESLSSPATFFAREPREASIWPTLAYGYVFSFVSSAINSAYQLTLGRDEVAEELARTPELAELSFLASPAFALAGFVLSPLFHLLNIYFWSGLWWLSLKAVGAANKPFHRIVRALSYVNAVTVLGVLQIFGDLIGALGTLVMLFWLSALCVVAMWKVQDTDLWRPVVALVLMAVILFSACCGFAMLLGFALASAT